jgi:hypothetical protein
LGDGSAASVVGVVAVEEVVAAEVVVGGSGGQDVPGGDEQAVRDGGLGAFAAAAGGDTAERPRSVLKMASIAS